MRRGNVVRKLCHREILRTCEKEEKYGQKYYGFSMNFREFKKAFQLGKGNLWPLERKPQVKFLVSIHFFKFDYKQ